MKVRGLASWVVLTTCVVTMACSERKATTGTGAQPSPNASILPAPLASDGELTADKQHAGNTAAGIPADSAGRLIVRDPEPPPPEPAAVDKPLPADTLTARDAVGYSLQAAFRWADLPQPAGVPESVPAAIKDALQKTELTVAVDLAGAGRLRMSLESAAFPLPAHTEIRSRTSYYGHVLVWPDGTSYRVLGPGSLRAMFAERRADVAPLLRAKVTALGNGSLLGHKTVKSSVDTSLGTLTLEQTPAPGSGTSGELLCRFLVELIGSEPTTEACHGERIPLSAVYRWEGGGQLQFVASAFTDRHELPLGYLYVPPAGADFRAGELPPSSSGVFLSQADLSKFRSRAAKGATPGSRAPGEGILADNQTTSLEYLFLDGVPVTWVKPKSRQYVIGPPAGRYTIAWRDFLGASVTPIQTVDLPTFTRVGTPELDGGSRP
jgi:hypothetical protein